MADERERQLPLRRAESAAFFILVVQAVAGGVALLLAWLTHSAAARAEGWHLLAGIVVWLAALVHQRLRRLAAEEALEARSLAAEEEKRTGASLFDAEGTDLLSARNRLAQFEKYFLPAFSAVVALVFAVLSYHLLRNLVAVEAVGGVANPLRYSFVFAGIAFVSFLLAWYAAGLATQRPWRPLRPGANYSMSCAVGSLLVALGFAGCAFGFPIVERVVAYVIPVMLGVLALEIVLHLVMGIYRPRVAGQEVRAPHDSRILGMLTTSRGILRTTAETLDYQFGFKVSETWFYRFMERALGPLIIFQAFTLMVLTCFVVIDTGEQAVIERFGKPRHEGETLGPGIHLKLPWPIDIVYRHPTKRVEVLAIGEQLKEDVPGYLWTESHAKEEFNLLSANRQQRAAPPRPGEGAPGPPKKGEARPAPGVSMITGTVNVFYQVRALYDYLYNHRVPKETLESLCYRELSFYAANTDFLQFLGYRRGEAMVVLKQRIQEAANREGLGIEILDVTLQGLHPPVQVAEAFENVVGALEEKEAKVWRATRYEKATLAKANAEAAERRAGARIYAGARLYLAPAREKEFLMQLEAYREAPSVFKHRKLLRVVEESLADSRKVIKPVWADVREVLKIDLEEQIPPGQFGGIDISGSEEGTTP